MPKYKNNTPQMIEGFLDKMFGKITSKIGQDVINNMKKKDPTVGKYLSIASDMIKKTEKHLASMSPDEQEKYKKQITKALAEAFESELSYYDQQRQSQVEIIKDQELGFIRRAIDAGIWKDSSEDQLNDILNQRISKQYDDFND